MNKAGDTFRRIRQARGMTIAEISNGGIISVSALSAFENNDTDISYAKMRGILAKVGVTFEEFEYILNRYNNETLTSLINRASTVYTEN